MRRHHLAGRIVLVSLLMTGILYACHRHVRNLDWYIDTFSNEGMVESFDFHQTPDEARCLHNTIASSKPPIPNVVHVIWLNNPELTFLNYLTMRSALDSIQPDTIHLHYTVLNESNMWLRLLQPRITLVPHDLEKEYPLQVQQGWQISHVADVLRLDILHQHGGIYLDMDVITLRSFDHLRNADRDVVLGHEGSPRQGLCNAIILARPHARFLTRWIESYQDFARSEWNYHSVVLPKQLATEYPDEICALSPEVFFWPTWTRRHVRFMHEPMDKAESVAFQATLVSNGGSMYENQRAYHGWSQVSTPYLQRLSPANVQAEDTRFNVLARRFLS
ncbi:hypothetical protein FE257_010462 [Aspergillus nanangensis]|uniref:Glycosyl transferase n=1 Tax=Aspergillus nanangensis TaxID=2582783 RepID=A0AAD4CK28_ASPNN|nr:hypothetical protein FE257_010462 [Aspergillus nanangensis]